jgi:hypothetical protein
MIRAPATAPGNARFHASVAASTAPASIPVAAGSPWVIAGHCQRGTLRMG